MESSHNQLVLKINSVLESQPEVATILKASLAPDSEAQPAGLSAVAFDLVGAITIVYLFSNYAIPWLVVGRVWTEQTAAKIVQGLHQSSEAKPEELERAVKASKKLHEHLSKLSDAHLQQPWIDLAAQLKKLELPGSK